MSSQPVHDIDSVKSLTEAALKFRDERNWQQFHTLGHLAAGLNIEAAEVQELFLWKTNAQAQTLVQSEAGRERLGEELADTLVYLLYLAHTANIDLPAALIRKLELNREKYPVEKSYNNALKYTDFESDQ